MAEEAERNSGGMFVDPSELRKDARLLHEVDHFGGVKQNARDRMNRRLYSLMLRQLQETEPDIEIVKDVGNLIMKMDKATLDWRKQLFAERGENDDDEEGKVNVGEIVRQLHQSDYCDDIYEEAMQDAAAEELRLYETE